MSDQIPVLVVDDDPAICECLVDIMSLNPSISIQTANGYRECLKHFQDGFHGILLLDVSMPEKNGFDTLREIIARDLLNDTIVVMVTAQEPGEAMAGLESYIFDYIKKPFSTTDLLMKVERYAEYL
ncbi:MAG: response regulator [Euryarchaeota archaeon]|nr:response regulator [Euryarchaeota archaeon]